MLKSILLAVQGTGRKTTPSLKNVVVRKRDTHLGSKQQRRKKNARKSSKEEIEYLSSQSEDSSRKFFMSHILPCTTLKKRDWGK
jgi:hypothetical protein